MAQNVRTIKRRIANIENIRQITKAMNAIAMTKLTRMKRRLEPVRPYVADLERFIAHLLAQAPEGSSLHPLMAKNGSDAVGILVINADRGLCGRFQGEINRAAEELLAQANGRGKLLAGGEKARSYFSSRRRVEVLRAYPHLYEEPTPQAAHRIAQDVIELYTNGQIGRLIVVGMRFISDLAQRVVTEELLPIRVAPQGREAIIEPGELPEMLGIALPLYIEGKIFGTLIETKTSEHAIRRQAMKNATDNADDLLTVLTRFYHKARQQSITREIADIVGGAEALRE